MVNNPNYYSQSTTSGFNQIEDGVDFPHTGIIKSLSDGLGQNYAISGFDITIDSATQIDVGAGVIFRDGKRHAISAVPNLALGRTTANENSYHLVSVASNDAIVIRSPSAKDKVPDYTAGDTIIAVVTHNGSNPMPIQYLTVNKTEHSLSVGRNDSGYTEGLTIQTNNTGATIEAKEQDKDIIFKVNDGGTPTEVMRIDGQQSFVGIGTPTPTAPLHVQRDTDGELVVLDSFTQNANVAPDIILRRSAGSATSGQGADGDGLGLISFQGRDATSNFGQNSVYAEFFGNIQNATNGAHNGQLRLRVAKAGASKTAINILSNEVVINEDSVDMNFRVESDGNANMLVVDASTDRIGIGTATPVATVDIAGDLRVTNNIFQQHKDMTNDLAVGWHTIAHIKGRSGGSESGTAGSAQRGIAQIIVKEESSSRHALYEFKVNHLFGTANAIQLENSAYYATKIIQQVRLKENSVYDGAVFQIYVADATNNLQVFITDNFADHGWTVNDAVADADNTGHNSLGLGYNNAYSTFSATRTYNLDTLDVVDGGTILGGNAFVQGNLTVNTGATFKSPRLKTISLTANTTLTEGTHAGIYLFVTGSSIVITIPDNQAAGVHFTIINNDGNGFTLRTGAGSSAGDNMNGAQTDIAVAARNGVTCISTGTDYVVLGV